LAATTAQGISHERLAQAALGSVDVCRIEEGDARVDGRVDDRVRALLGGRRGLLSAKVVAAEADGRDDEAGVAEGAVFNVRHSFSLRPTTAPPQSASVRSFSRV